MTTSPSGDPLVGHVLDGRYRINRKLARGGMATVYLADDLRLTRVVAVKVMHQGLGDDQDFTAKFDREARAAARLQHPNVVSVFDQGVDGGRPYIVMEYVEGATLRHLITREAPFDPLRALDLLLPVAKALASAHEAGLIHRDIKPENVLISDRGQVKVADFGLAKAISAQTATATGMLIGTVSYIAPELVTHGKADPRCDVYAVGVVLYEMLTGQKPHTGENPIQVAYSHVHNSIPAPSAATKASWRDSRSGIPPYLDALVMAAAARDPEERPVDGRVLLDHLQAARDALAQGLMDDPTLSAQVQQTRLDPATQHTDVVPMVSPNTGDIVRVPTLRFTPTTPVSPGFPQSADGLPYYDGPPADVRPLVQQPAAHRQRRRWPLLLLLLLLTLGLASGTAWFAYGRTVPDLRKLTQQQAASAINAAGLQVKFDSEYSEDIPAGQVTRTDPAAGQRASLGSEVRAYLSKGPERYAVPKLAGKTLDEATLLLTDAHLVVGTTTPAYDDKIADGSVISSSIKAGTQVKPGTTINLTVSQGPAPVTLADWTNKPIEEATKALEADGLVVKVTKTQFSDEVADKAIISQTPPAGEVHRGDTVSFVVSKGPEFVVVPSVSGRGVTEAKRLLTAAGFKVKTRYIGPSRFGIVYSSNPAGGTKARTGSTVTINLV